MELKPCPCCSSSFAELHDNDWCDPPEWYVRCKDCGLKTDGRTDKAKTITAWNHRPSVEDEAVKAARKIVDVLKSMKGKRMAIKFERPEIADGVGTIIENAGKVAAALIRSTGE